MQDQDKQKFKQLLDAIFNQYKTKANDMTYKLWWSCMKDFEYNSVELAFTKYLQKSSQSHFCPQPGDIVEIISGSSSDRALEAQSKVEKAIRCIGHYSSLVFDDPIIHRVMQDMGGWVDLATTSDRDKLVFKMNEFRRRYEKYEFDGVTPDYPKRIAGQAEIQNRGQQGYKPDVQHIGKIEDCRSVFKGGNDKVVNEIGYIEESSVNNRVVQALELISKQ